MIQHAAVLAISYRKAPGSTKNFIIALEKGHKEPKLTTFCLERVSVRLAADAERYSSPTTAVNVLRMREKKTSGFVCS